MRCRGPAPFHVVGAALTPPAPLSRALAGVLLALADGETLLHLADGFGDAREWIGFHCGSGFGPAGEADFVVASAMPDLAGLRLGTDDMPETGATLILQVKALGEGVEFMLSGPGIKETQGFAVDGLPDGFVAAWAANHALYPLGVDLILCAGDRVACFPRSLTVEAK